MCLDFSQEEVEVLLDDLIQDVLLWAPPLFFVLIKRVDNPGAYRKFKHPFSRIGNVSPARQRVKPAKIPPIPAVLRSCAHPKRAIWALLALIRGHKAERVHRP